VFKSTVYKTEHPVVQVHPLSGERAIILGYFVRKLLGVSSAESAHLFAMLQDHVTRLENMVRWRWSEGDVVIWDNLKPHQSEEAIEAVEAAGAQVVPLPPWSPDLTPIEEMFSKVKGSLRSAAARTKETVYAAFGSALHDVTLDNIAGWFQHRAAYCAMQGHGWRVLQGHG
jgi:transposase